MLTHGELCRKCIFGTDGLDDSLVLRHGVVESARQLQGLLHDAVVRELVHEEVVVLTELLIVGTGNQRVVKVVHERGVRGLIFRLDSRTLVFNVDDESLELRGVATAGEEACGEPLEGLFELKEFDDLTRGRFANECADAGTNLYEPLTLELLQCLPDRGAAHLKFFGECGFCEEVSGHHRTADDEAAESIQERPGLQRYGCSGVG